MSGDEDRAAGAAGSGDHREEGAGSGGDVSADGVAEGDEGGASSDAPGGSSGDDRLRAAVAAWVRSGDSKDAEAAPGREKPAEGAGADDSGAADGGGNGAPAAVGDAEDESESSEDVSGAATASGPEAPKPATSGDNSDAGSEPDTSTADANESADGKGAAARAGTASKSVAGDPRAAHANAAAAGAGSAPKGDTPDGGADAAAKADTPAADEATASKAAAPGAGASPADKADAPAATADAAPVADTPVTGETAAPKAAAPGAGASPADKADAPAPAADAAPKADDTPAADEATPSKADASAAGASPVGKADAKNTPETGDGPAKRDPSRSETPDGKPKPPEGTPSDREDRKPVDQPTAIFKRPQAKPQVDQPTTMLKLGDVPKAPEKRAPEKKAPEPPAAERTSKFVALKPLDEPGARQPADATAQVPQVGPERTAQQPLPPKPPMDLLAELTNTPPPPQTPVRTLVRRVKIWTPLVLLLVIVFAIVQAVRPLPTPTLALTADDSYTFDGDKADLPWPSEGQGWMDVNGIGTMGNFGKQTPVAVGSVAKAMTAYLVLKDHPLKPGAEGEKITVDALAEKEGGYDKDGESTLNTVKKGDVLTERQALSAVMIPSANNIARLLARWDAGSEAAFIKKMNDTAKKLGMRNTTYTDASGLKETTVSTSEDQVKLGNELVKIPALMEITKLPNWTDPSGHRWRNYNALVPYNGALGIKTGTTTKAGGNLLFAATKEVGGETVTVVGAILGQHTAPIIDTVNAVSKTAMLAAQDALTSTKILKKGSVVGYVDDQLGGHTPIVLTKDVTAVGWAGLKVKLSFDADDVPHTAKAGTQVGTLTVGDGSNGAVKVPVALQKDLAEPGFGAKLKRIG
ncbi:D-alanyl-D-alanine carboxypeptidase [Streptomyces spinosirectus]|uniref:D-alanyl-D-alanine carboxypeptidase n=1 Tax=Streptomyces spinosirectus TaxID=2906474 RepID=UPI0030F4012D